MEMSTLLLRNMEPFLTDIFFRAVNYEPNKSVEPHSNNTVAIGQNRNHGRFFYQWMDLIRLGVHLYNMTTQLASEYFLCYDPFMNAIPEL
jgi:hypothetical protein